ncbi:MAG: helix-turn-helix domain-containing protein [Lachnospiraceae bacterium]|nr:helix-turn-helix domain-containing protein [Lachnospiraceae bacterium]
MKVCEIRDEYNQKCVIGYLFYFPTDDIFSVEISDDAGEEDVPLFLSSFVRKNQRTVDPQWSSRWVESRIVPRDRQNLGTVLRDNGLDGYDRFRLLMLGEGRCAQDDCALVPVQERRLPAWLRGRMEKKLSFVAALPGWDLLCIFRDGSIRRVNIRERAERERGMQILVARPRRFFEARVLAGGVGVTWGDDTFLSGTFLYHAGKKLPLTREELRTITGHYVLDTADVCRELHCSRQYVSQLVKKNVLTELKEGGHTRLYTRDELPL